MVQKGFILLYKIYHNFSLKISSFSSLVFCKLLFYFNGVKFDNINSFGFPFVNVAIGGECVIGKNFKMNNGVKFSDSGINGKCRIDVRNGAKLIIGNNVGMSDVTITCHRNITIGNNVLLGVGTQIRDTDNHSLNPMDRINGLDWKNKKTAPINIGDNVFIGANCIILKGVNIGSNSIVGAGSVVSKDIPSDEIWGGNPAKFIKGLKF